MQTGQKIQVAVYVPMAVVACWMGMMLVHESGHVISAICTGADLYRIQFPIIGFSQTILGQRNPHPLTVAWCGPLVGAIVPAAMVLIMKLDGIRLHFTTLFAGFCLVANGAYLGIGSFWRVGDCNDLLREGAPIWALWAFGVAATVAGFWFWHTLGARLGIPEGVRNFDIVLAVTVATLLVGVSLLSTMMHLAP